jgi:hypothetical protein
MATQTADAALEVRGVQNAERYGYPVAAATKLYQDQLIGLNSTVARALVSADKFLGLASCQVDNTDGAAGDRVVTCVAGHQVKVDVTGAANTSVGTLVYASDDCTFTTTQSTNSIFGVITEWLTGTTCWVKVFTAAEVALYGQRNLA